MNKAKKILCTTGSQNNSFLAKCQIATPKKKKLLEIEPTFIEETTASEFLFTTLCTIAQS